MTIREHWAKRVMELANAAVPGHPELAAVLMILAKTTYTGDLDRLAPVLRLFVEAMAAEELTVTQHVDISPEEGP